ncbi:MAG: hypothetical protein EU536_02940 [Promethearchaeota archaeon]|nr:MAG: hypothetical protein EU536_02940 [Candidatus Lokiarchaeota archaeon]
MSRNELQADIQPEILLPIFLAHSLHDIALPIETLKHINDEVEKMLLQYKGIEVHKAYLRWKPTFIFNSSRFLQDFPVSHYIGLLDYFNRDNHGIYGALILSYIFESVKNEGVPLDRTGGTTILRH